MIKPITKVERERAQEWAQQDGDIDYWLVRYEALVVDLERRLKIAQTTLRSLNSFTHRTRVRLMASETLAAMAKDEQ